MIAGRQCLRMTRKTIRSLNSSSMAGQIKIPKLKLLVHHIHELSTSFTQSKKATFIYSIAFKQCVLTEISFTLLYTKHRILTNIVCSASHYRINTTNLYAGYAEIKSKCLQILSSASVTGIPRLVL